MTANIGKTRLLAVPLVVSAALGLGCASAIIPANADERASSSSWSLSPDNGPSSGGTEVFLTPPQSGKLSKVSAGTFHSLAVGFDGKAYAWGNGYKLGNGDPKHKDSNVPVQVATPAGTPAGFKFTQVSAGEKHSLAVGSDGKAYAWGFNDCGKLGNNSNKYVATPVQVATPAGTPAGFKFTQVSAGAFHSLAVGSDGKAYAWGNGYKLGNGDPKHKDSWVPVQVATPAGTPAGFKFTQVSAGTLHSLAVGSDGKAYAWGNGYKLGNGDPKHKDSNVPVQVATPAGVRITQVSAGEKHSLAVDGNIEATNVDNAYAWGFNECGKLGDGTKASKRLTPVHVNGIHVQPSPDPEVNVTAVKFGGIDSLTAPARQADGTWKVTAPAHFPGSVDVSVDWNLNGVGSIEHLDYRYNATQYYTVIVDPNNGSPSEAISVAEYASVPVPADPSRHGYVFEGWFKGSIPYDFSQPVTSDFTLVAHWIPIPKY